MKQVLIQVPKDWHVKVNALRKEILANEDNKTYWRAVTTDEIIRTAAAGFLGIPTEKNPLVINILRNALKALEEKKSKGPAPGQTTIPGTE